MASVGLCVITDELTPALRDRLEGLEPYVDEVYLQVNGRFKPSLKKFTTSIYVWNDHFAKARNVLLKRVKTDYWLWLDSDDLLVGAENIRKVVDRMEATGVELMYAPYTYQLDDAGNPIEVQQRERIIKTSLAGKWQGRVHETFIPNGTCETEHTDLVQWLHTKTPEAHEESTKRNRRLMLQGYNEDNDPRYAYYLGVNYEQTGEYDEAIKWFEKLIQDGGWDEERYRSWLHIASCHQQAGRWSEAINAYNNATTELPTWPDAYYGLQQVYYELDDHEKSLEWFKVGSSKPIPETNSAFNPVVRTLQPLCLAAYSYLAVGEVEQSVNVAKRLKKLEPSYANLKELEPIILKAWHDTQAIEKAKDLIAYNQKYDGDPLAVLNSLPPTVRADIRLTDERRTLIPGKTWPKGSIVFYCGQSFEPWGPDTLDQGMGGSEEAVVYLSRELAIKDHYVFVYNERTEQYQDWIEYGDKDNGGTCDVMYLPWTEINPNDTFDVFVAWRTPTDLKNIKARVKLCDVHDLIDPQIVYNNQEYVDKYLFKSVWHRERYPELPDNKCVVIGNGISKEMFA